MRINCPVFVAFVAYGWVGGSEGASTNPQNHPQPTNNASLPKLGKDATSLLAAVASDVTGSVWLCPSEVIKQVGGWVGGRKGGGVFFPMSEG